MRMEICDIAIYPPIPKLANLVNENVVLKKENNGLNYLVFGGVAIGLVFLLMHMHNQKKNNEIKFARPIEKCRK